MTGSLDRFTSRGEVVPAWELLQSTCIDRKILLSLLNIHSIIQLIFLVSLNDHENYGSANYCSKRVSITLAIITMIQNNEGIDLDKRVTCPHEVQETMIRG